MPHLGFDVRDYSTGARVCGPPVDELLVLVPRRHNGLPPLVERSHSSFRVRERRNYFDTTRTASGLVVIADAPPGTYDVRIQAPRYVPFRASFAAPMASPVRVPLHRDATFVFGAGDTLIRGSVRKASGAAHTGFDVRLTDLTEPAVPKHRVPLNAKGEFVLFIPEKKTTGGVNLDVFHSTGSVLVNLAVVLLHHSNLLSPPFITVP